MRRSIGLFLLSVVVGASHGFSPARTLAQELATISVNPQSPRRVIPSDFGGLSIEVEDAANRYLGPASSPNWVFYELLKNLGQGTIRIGGDSADYACWDAASAPRLNDCRVMISPDAIAGYLRASATTDWGLIIDVNLAQNSARWALSYGIVVAKATRRYPGSKVMFEFGNEPNLYPSENISGNPVSGNEESIRPRQYSWKDHVAEWRSYTAAFQADPATKSFPLVGPAYDTSNAWINLYLGSFLDGVGAKNLALAAVHEYPTHNCSPEEAAQITIADMLSQKHLDSYVRRVISNDWVGNAQRRGLDLQLEETGYTACANKAEVNNVYASALWSLDWLFTNFELGFRRINFYLYPDDYSVIHASGTRESTGQINYSTFAEPGYYAMYAFSQNAQGKALLPVDVSTGSNVKAYAVRDARTGSVTVFVLNKDLSASGSVVVESSATMGPASLLLVRAADLSSTAVTYGARSFDPKTGRLSGAPETTTVNVEKGKYSFMLPHASIAVLTIKPAKDTAKYGKVVGLIYSLAEHPKD